MQVRIPREFGLGTFKEELALIERSIMTGESNTEQSPGEGLGPALHQFTQEEEVPEFYADALNVSTSLYGTAIQFGTRPTPTAGDHTKLHGILRLSPQITKIFAAILIKQLRSYENTNGRISIPRDVAESIGIVDELEALEPVEGEGNGK